MNSRKTTITRLCTRKEYVADKVAVYKLFQAHNSKGYYFAIKISMEGENIVCKFGKDISQAMDIFCKIVRNKVTPCCLSDIAEDFRN